MMRAVFALVADCCSIWGLGYVALGALGKKR